MSTKIASSPSTIDPYKHLHIVPNPDGTLTRSKYKTVAASPDPVNNVVVLSKDVTINQSNKTWARIFIPRQALDYSLSNKLPVMFYYQPGGLVHPGVALPVIHELCSDLAIKIPAVVVSLEYRVAPEHRLPAAYDDAVEVLYWSKATQEEWITKYADLSCCFLMGGCAGGNIVYHAGLRAAAQVENLLPLQIRGLILHQPAFGGVKRTESELRFANDRFLPLCVLDLLFELTLPVGADRDHDYCNPMEGGGSNILGKIKLLGWKVMVTGWDRDPLFDRQVKLAKMMEQKGVQVVSHFDEGGYHSVDMRDPAKRNILLVNVTNFVRKSIDRSLSPMENGAQLLKLSPKL